MSLFETTSALPDGSYEEGAFNWLHQKRYAVNGTCFAMIERYRGLVLSEYERNRYDDSDFYAVVWDEKAQKPKNVMYATTRAWTYENGCTIDATPEVLAKYDAYQFELKRQWAEYDRQLKEYIPEKGKTVRSITTRGKAHSKTGTISWIGASKYTGALTVGFRDEANKIYYVEIDRCEIWSELKQEWVKCASKNNNSYFSRDWFVPDSVLPWPKG